MPVIDLETGKLVEPKDSALSFSSPMQSQIIDLDTGSLSANEEPGQSTRAFLQRKLSGPLTPEQEIQRKQQVEQLPELLDAGLLFGEDKAKVAAVSPVLLTTTDPREMAGILSSNFPNVGISETPEGELIATNNQTGAVAVINRPGISKLDVLQGLGIVSAFTPAGAASTIPARTAAAAATETGIQVAQEAAGGEFTPEDVALAGALSLAGEVVGPVAQNIRQLRRPAQEARELGVTAKELEGRVLPTEQTARQAQQAIQEQTGVEVGLFPAQKTLIPAELQKQRILPQLSPSSRKAYDALSQQNEEVFDATTQLIDRIVPKGQAVNAEARLRDAAQKFDEILENERQQAFSAEFLPALQSASASNTKVSVDNVQDVISNISGGHRSGSPISKLMSDISGGLSEADRTIIDGTNLQALHNFKREISQKVSQFESRTGPLDKELKADVARIYDSLATALRRSSPEYNAAMDAFIAKTPEIEAFRASLLGRVSQLSDGELLGIAAKIYDRRVSPQDIAQAKKVVETVDPGAWQAIVSKEVDNRIGGIVALANEQGADFITNMPAQLKAAIFGNPRQRQVLLRSMDNTQRQNFKHLETILSRAAAGRTAGSPTASFTEVIQGMRGRLGMLKDVFTRPLNVIQETGDTTLFERRVKALADAAFDPKFNRRYEEIRKMSNTEAASRAMFQLLDEVEQEEENVPLQ